MDYEQWWKTLETLIAEFRKKQLTIPTEVMTSLRSAKTMINVYNADQSYLESIPTIENYLINVESNLINMAKEKFGQAFMERWIKKLEDARKEVKPKAESTTSRFILGLPKGEHWIRVLPSDDVLKENVEKLAGELGLSCKMQKDGYMLVYGSKEKVKGFVKKMAEKCRGTRKN
ncbi:MAG: DUF2096 domain-containing protein [Candidatus Bathyarchaeota archaeon]|nr:DUF2096 domain-containing protein [Candidatus Bathyarchaeota archaeon]MDH5494682.1 DUF2096 domain-containing protein [Candidatus Bathyarchaeota archaeon]